MSFVVFEPIGLSVMRKKKPRVYGGAFHNGFLLNRYVEVLAKDPLARATIAILLQRCQTRMH